MPEGGEYRPPAPQPSQPNLPPMTGRSETVKQNIEDYFKDARPGEPRGTALIMREQMSKARDIVSRMEEDGGDLNAEKLPQAQAFLTGLEVQNAVLNATMPGYAVASKEIFSLANRYQAAYENEHPESVRGKRTSLAMIETSNILAKQVEAVQSR